MSTVMQYAIIDASGNVINSVMWDGGPEWQPPEGCTAVQNDAAGPGWTYVNGTFYAAPVPSTHPEE